MSYMLFPWAVVLTSMAGAWLLTVIGMWVADQGRNVAEATEAKAATGPPRD